MYLNQERPDLADTRRISSNRFSQMLYTPRVPIEAPLPLTRRSELSRKPPPTTTSPLHSSSVSRADSPLARRSLVEQFTPRERRCVWVEHSDLVYAPAEVVNDMVDGGTKLQVRLMISGELRQILTSSAQTLHPSCLRGVADLLELGELDMPALLHNVRQRYAKDRIYTAVGPQILISVNPYCNLPRLYSAETAAQYRSVSNLNELQPHPFAIAQRALEAVCCTGPNVVDQSVIISGESGAGKTEATKILLSYLANTIERAGRNPQRTAMETQLTESNPLLEAFGNAKTIRNDNSSRFGKFTRVLIGRRSRRIVGARISSYLLEKSRIVMQQKQERNYHIFYQLCASVGSLPEQLQKELMLRPAAQFRLLASCDEVASRDDAGDFEEVLGSLKALEFEDKTCHDVWRVLAGLLHLGEVHFAANEDDELVITTQEQLDVSARLLGLPKDRLSQLLRYSSIKDPQTGKSILSPRTIETASVSRDGLCKTMYEGIFQWLIQEVNGALSGLFEVASGTEGGVGSVGLLDIFGFEIFEENSFEQLCINFANEQLQQHFNRHVFAEEQALYESESINWQHIQFQDNGHILEALTGKNGGVLPLLDSECHMPCGSDKTFLSKMQMAASESSVVLKPRSPLNTTEFGILHYAGEVFYDVRGMVDKNRDRVQTDVQQLLSLSRNKVFLAGTPQAGSSPVSGSFAKATVGYAFREQLRTLMEVLSSTNATYLRCIKPNGFKLPHAFASAEIMRQLRCAGMLESIRIRKTGYALRFDVRHFIKVFGPIIKRDHGGLDERDVAKMICKRLAEEHIAMEEKRTGRVNVNGDLLWQLGNTRVFLKDPLQSAAERLMAQIKVDAFMAITGGVRVFLARKKLKQLRRANRTLTTMAHTVLWQERLKKWHTEIRAKRAAAAKVVQRAWRAILIRRAFRKIVVEATARNRRDAAKATEDAHQTPRNAAKVPVLGHLTPQRADEHIKSPGPPTSRTFGTVNSTVEYSTRDLFLHTQPLFEPFRESPEVKDAYAKLALETQIIELKAKLNDVKEELNAKLNDVKEELLRNKAECMEAKDANRRIENDLRAQMEITSDLKHKLRNEETIKNDLSRRLERETRGREAAEAEVKRIQEELMHIKERKKCSRKMKDDFAASGEKHGNETARTMTTTRNNTMNHHHHHIIQNPAIHRWYAMANSGTYPNAKVGNVVLHSSHMRDNPSCCSGGAYHTATVHRQSP